MLRLTILVLLAANVAPGDTIRLKNGRTIWADQVREVKGRIEYDVGDDSYAIPKSAVERIDTGGVAPTHSGSHGTLEVPDFAPPAPTFSHEADVTGKVIHDGKIDTEALDRLERDGNTDLAAAGYFLAGKFEVDRGNMAQAKHYFDLALRLEPDNSVLLTYYAACLLRTGHAPEAVTYAQRAVRADPNSPDALAMLGFVQSAADNTPQAIDAWKKSLKLRPDATISQYLERAERESKAESEFSQRESSHFNLHFEGKQTSESFRRDLLATLEAHYDDLVRDLGYSPHNTLAVTLYTEQAFFDVTRAPSWSGAVNDGKLRIPISGIGSMTSDLSRVLKHELTHSFVNQMSGGRCPTWLHEGIAQIEEGKSSATYGRPLAQMFAAGQEIPYNALEGSFMRFSTPEAVMAYAESLAAVEYFRDTYGMSDIPRILERLAQGSSTESALRATVHTDYSQLRDELARWLKDKYGD